MSDKLGITLKEVIINDLVEGIFHAKLILDQGGNEVEIDARSSDAIALALRFDCPISTFEFILSAAGLKVDDDEENASSESMLEGSKEKGGRDPGAADTLEELRELLEEALDNEDYERASKLRDEIKKREGSN